MTPTLTLHQHPFASFCWKPLIALYELGLPFEPLLADADGRERLAQLWPLARIPVLEDDQAGVAVFGSSACVEHADALAGGRLLPADDPQLARRARMWDRIVDDYVQVPMQTIVGDSLRPADARDPFGVEQARATLDTAYAVLDRRFAETAAEAGGVASPSGSAGAPSANGDAAGWLAGDRFTLADCAAVPALFYARVVHPWDEQRLPALTRGYGALVRRPSAARVIDEARPYRELFPLPWPDNADAHQQAPAS